MKIKNLLTCSSCVHLVRDKAFEKPCAELGKLPSSKSCDSHIGDIHDIVRGEGKLNQFQYLGEMMHSMSPRQLEILASLVIREKQTRKHGFKFYQKVYYKIHSSRHDYLSHYCKCRILDITKKALRLISDDGTVVVSIYFSDDGSLAMSNLFNAKQFDQLRAKLVAEKRISDPEQHKPSPVRVGIQELQDLTEKSLKGQKFDKKKTKKYEDLVSVMARVQEGKFKKSDIKHMEEIEIKY